MNKLDEAANILRNGWCRDSFREDLPEGQQFCSTGALATAIFETSDFVDEGGDIKQEWVGQWKTRICAGPEVAALNKVIMEQYPEHINYNFETLDLPQNRAANVIAFNDCVAVSSDEIIAVFEKASALLDENK